MSDLFKEKRRQIRKPAEGYFRIYSSVTSCAYTVKLKDISKNGAFIHSRYPPKVGETITFIILDNSGNERFVGNAKVARVKTTGNTESFGFGIKIDHAFIDEIYEDLQQ